MKYSVFFLVFLYLSLFASPLSETLGDPGSTNPFSARMSGNGPASVYFNPALLSLEEKQFSFNTFYTYQNLRISYGERPEDADITGNRENLTGIYGAKISEYPDRDIPFKPLPTDKLYKERGSFDNTADNFYASMGFVFPVIKNHLAFGVYALLPMGKLQEQSTFFVDEREQYFSNSLHFELYEDRMTSQTISAALSGGWKWIYFGAGLSVVTNAQVNAEIFTQDTSTKMDVSTESEFGTSVIPHFGLQITPWRSLFLTATLHLPSKSKINSENNISFWGGSEGLEAMENTEVNIVYGYKPLTFSIGTGFSDMKITSDMKISAGVSAEFRNWSDYRNRYSKRPENNLYWDWTKTSAAGDYEKQGAWVSQTVDKYKWKNTWSIITGTSFSWKKFKVGLDFAYVPSPVPDQDGRTNYVDNDKFNLGTGISYEFPLYGNFNLSAGVGFQAQIFSERSVKKTNIDSETGTSFGKDGAIIDEFPDSECDDFCGVSNNDLDAGDEIPESRGVQSNNPGYGGFTSRGVIYTAGIWLKLLF